VSRELIVISCIYPVANFVEQKETSFDQVRLILNPLERFYFTLLVHWCGMVNPEKGREMN
jgi:hypothetical protein